MKEKTKYNAACSNSYNTSQHSNEEIIRGTSPLNDITYQQINQLHTNPPLYSNNSFHLLKSSTKLLTILSLTFLLLTSSLLLISYQNKVDFTKAWIPLNQIAISYNNPSNILGNNNKIDTIFLDVTLQNISDTYGLVSSSVLNIGGINSAGSILAGGKIYGSNGLEITRGDVNLSGVLYVNDTTGNVGIGTENPQGKLEVRLEGNRYLKVYKHPTQDKSIIQIFDEDGGDSVLATFSRYGDSILALNLQGITNWIVFANRSDSSLHFGKGGSFEPDQGIFLTISYNGSVGINTKTPETRLDVRGYEVVSPSMDLNLTALFNSNSPGIDTNVGIFTSRWGEGIGENATLFIGQNDYKGFIRYDNKRDVFIIGRDNRGVAREIISIPLLYDNVGISTTSPQAKLHIKGKDPSTGLSLYTEGGDVNLSGVVYVNTSTFRGGIGLGKKYNIPYNPGSPPYLVYITPYEPNTGSAIELKANGSQNRYPHGPYIDFSNNITDEYDVRIMLYGDNALGIIGGNLGIATTNPTYTLQVGNAGDGTSAIANAWNTFSDVRFKENITTITNALSLVRQLRGVKFKWKNSSKEDIGLIAQEVESILPEVVYEDSNGYKGIAYDKLVAVLIQAIKEQQEIIEKQNRTIQAILFELCNLSPNTSLCN